ncbi:SDR family NAD(P)-dependent oxidoreductase [Saccharothrix mutabilis subsp. mutabilis]|uniref:SDR family NAD(P)-dependent oxidoreductase n=1 Tax=Saccharothrix mutabilis subsp. mutabilis TaxID=66855 RepID=A0ABN0TBC5_9PSEU
MTNNLQGKVALVTGASSGIGEATAVALGRAGASVVVAARRVERLAAVEARLAEEGVKVLALELDVTDEAACRAAVERTVEVFGGLDVLVNNAGVMLLGNVLGADTEDWRRMVSTNLLGVMYLTHAALPHLVERRGAIVQISSTAGRGARPTAAVYAATKFGLNAFSESLRQEVAGDGVRVVVVEPGVVETELREHITDANAKNALEDRITGMRQLQADDIAAAVLYAVTQPEHVSVNEILVRPTDQLW